MHTGLLPIATRAALERDAGPYGFYIIEDDIEIVEVYRRFLYTGVLYTKRSTQQWLEWGWLADIYLLGVHLEDEKFRNAVIDGVVEKFAETVSLH